MNKKTDNGKPNTEVDVRKTFEIDADLKVMGFKQPNEYVPTIDEAYKFDKNTKLKMLGRISMDLIIIDITKVKNKIKLGDFVELYNKKFTIDKFADLTGTIPYRVITCISDRFSKNYL